MPDVIMGVSLLILFAVVNEWGNGVIGRMGWGEDHLGLVVGRRLADPDDRCVGGDGAGPDG